MIEEGVSYAVFRDIQHDTCGEGMGCHTAYQGCFFSVVFGSGVWVNIGRSAYKPANRLFIPTHNTIAENYTANEEKHLRAKDSYNSTFTYKSADPIVVLKSSLCARTIGIGACPGQVELRSGWRATRLCNCDDSWDLLNCFGKEGQSQPILSRAKYGPWINPWRSRVWSEDVPWPGMPQQLRLSHEAVVENDNQASQGNIDVDHLASWLPKPKPCSRYNANQAKICSATFDGVKIQYVQIIPEQVLPICSHMQKIRNRRPNNGHRKRFSFTFVADPFTRILDSLQMSQTNRMETSELLQGSWFVARCRNVGTACCHKLRSSRGLSLVT